MVKNLRSGFTLAEVLTTLMIIGVVAAMTIPTLLNSTADQQTRVALKKAASVLGQAVQLSVAKEVECQVTNSETLTTCMARLLSGTPIQAGQGSSSAAGAKDVIITPDGMAYKFIYSDSSHTTSSPEPFRNLIDICGEGAGQDSTRTGAIFQNTADSWKGVGAHCAVIVDINGLGKATKWFMEPDTNFATAGFHKADTTTNTSSSFAGSDQFAFVFTGDGIRPVGFPGADTSNHLNDAYFMLYNKAINDGNTLSN